MKIAVTYEKGNVFGHFGHTENFKIYNVNDNIINSCEIVPVIGQGHGALAEFLKSLDVDILICGGIGGGAQNALKDAGIKFYGGVSGSADDAVNALINDKLNFNPDVNCNHHGEGHNHEHSCSGHTGCKNHCGS